MSTDLNKKLNKFISEHFGIIKLKKIAPKELPNIPKSSTSYCKYFKEKNCQGYTRNFMKALGIK